MKVLCTKTGPCDHFAPFTDDVPWCKAKGGSNCPYYTRTGLAEVIEYGPQSTGDVALMQEWGKAAAEAASYRLLCDALLEEYEELAGENRRLRAAFDDAVDTYVGQTMGECPGPGWYWVRGHWRSRNQAVGSPDPTEDTTDAPASDPGASGEATDGPWPPGSVVPNGITLWQCEDCGKVVSRMDHPCVPPSPDSEMCVQEHTEERSE